MVVSIEEYLEIITERENTYIIKKENLPFSISITEGKLTIPENITLPAVLKTSTNIRVIVKKPYFNNLFIKKFQRKAQIIHEKDLSYILKKYYLGRDAKVLEAGGGSGHATIYLAQLYKEVTTLEKRKDFLEVIRKNLKKFNIKNVNLINADFLEYETSIKYDLLLLDFKTSHNLKAIKKAKELLTLGGYLLLYLPVIEQVKDALDNLIKEKFINIEVKEIMLREWHTSPLRPEFKMLGHTAFIVSARRF